MSKNNISEKEFYLLAKTNTRHYSKFLQKHFGLVKIIARKYSQLDDFEDLFQEGCIGLIKAFNKFDPEKGYSFQAYARWWVRDSIVEYLWKTNLIKITRDQFLNNKKPKKECNTEINIENLLQHAGEETLIERLHKKEVSKIIRRIIYKLPPQERTILRMRFGLTEEDEESTYLEIGNKLGYSKQRIQQIVKSALNNFKILMEKLELNKDLSLSL